MIFSFLKKNYFGLITLFLAIPTLVNAQSDYKVISTAVPFMTITPDAKSASMGDAGAASNPDANAVFWNTSKLAFAQEKSGISGSYAPWLKDIVGDMALYTVNGYKKISENQTLTGGFTYFNQGEIEFTNSNGGSEGTFKAREWVATAGIAQKLSSDLSIGLNWKFVNSNLVGNLASNGQTAKPGRTMAFDLGMYYNRNRPSDDENSWDFAYGLVIQNFGGKVNYGVGEYFIPANLKIGTKASKKVGEHNNFTFLLDFNKLLVPTPKTNANTTATVSSFSALFSSFSDAQGGMKEELAEITTSVGAEYSYDDLLALRAGYFHENPNKGGRRYFTSGLGVRLNESFKFDAAYLIPVNTGNPLANSWRVGFTYAVPNF